MSSLKILSSLEILWCVNLYLSFKARKKKNKSMPVGKIKSPSSPSPHLSCSSAYMWFVKWTVIERSDDKNCSGVAKKAPRGLLASVVPGQNYQISLLDSNATLSIRIHHLFCGVEELSWVIPIIPKPGFSISPATCWVPLLRFNGIWIYHHLWEERKCVAKSSLHLLCSVEYNLYKEKAKAAGIEACGRII